MQAEHLPQKGIGGDLYSDPLTETCLADFRPVFAYQAQVVVGLFSHTVEPCRSNFR